MRGMKGGIADMIASDQLVLAVDIDVVLVAVMALAVLFRPSLARQGIP